MALTRFFFASSLLLLPLLVIASAGDYGYASKPDVKKPTGDYSYGPKPELDTSKPVEKENLTPKPDFQKPEPVGDYGYGSKPDLEKPKPEYEKKLIPKTDLEKPNPTGDYAYGPKPELDTSKPVEQENLTPRPDLQNPEPAGDYGYGSKPQNPEPVPDYGYGSKPDLQKPKPAGDYGYGLIPDLYQPKPELLVGCEGLVLCKSGSKYVPIKGAVAKITCLAVGEQGYQTAPFSTYSCETDEKGYFFAPLSHLELNDKLKLTQCKAYLENSPLETCKVPTDVNKGISGASLSSYRFLNDKNMNLYSVGPFFYSEEPESTPTGY